MNEVAWLLLLVPAVVFGLAAAWLFSRAGQARGRALLLAAGVAIVSLAGTVVFAFDQLVYSLSENGPQYYPFSTYVRYRRAMDGPLGVVLLALYAAVPAALATAAVLAARRWPQIAVLLGVAALAAPALPVAVASSLPRSEYGKDPVLRSNFSPTGRPSGPIVPCFTYGVERPGQELSDQAGEPPPSLCLRLKRTPEAARLANGDSTTDEPSIYDIAYELNRMEVRPYDLPKEVDLEGIEIERAWWSGRQVPTEDRPRQPDEISEEELTARQREFARRAHRDIPPGRDSGCVRHVAPSRWTGLGPPAPRVEVSRRESSVEIEYEFASYPRSELCQPFAVVGAVSAGRPGAVTFGTSLTRVRVTELSGRLVVDFGPLRGQEPDRVSVQAVSLANWSSEEVTIPLK